MQTNPHLPGKFVWFEHVSPDVSKAGAFYAEWLGWHIERVPIGDGTYPMILNGGTGIGGLRAAQPGEAGQTGQWESYLSVPDVDERYAAALAAGAKACVAPMDIGQVGRGAALQDPTGAALSLWKSAGGDRSDAEQVPIGDWYWNELWTPDAKKAVAFYEKLAGYTHDVMPMGEAGDYYILKAGDAMRGGVTPSTELPPQWLPYVHVADCDATVKRAEGLGVKAVMIPPSDIPNIGRFAVLIDPFGATIAVITGAARG